MKKVCIVGAGFGGLALAIRLQSAGIATTLYEAVRRGIARLLGRPDPGAVDAAKLLPVTYVVASLLLLMTLILVYADIVTPVSVS